MAKKSAEDFEIPMTMSQRLEDDPPWEGYAEGKLPFPTDSAQWYDKKANKALLKKYMWAAPFDPRFPHQNQSR